MIVCLEFHQNPIAFLFGKPAGQGPLLQALLSPLSGCQVPGMGFDTGRPNT